MRVHYLQHVPFEGIGAVQDWVDARGHELSGTELFGDWIPAGMPAPEHFDLLVVMGGPMGVYDDADYAWLAPEKALIGAAVGSGKAVLGICLGAQLIAAALGATVTRAAHKEIGWYPVELTKAGRSLPVFEGFPSHFPALHWHGDTFAIPREAAWAASSAACPNQAFALAEAKVVGLQFHLEETRDSLSELVAHAGHELRPCTPSDAETRWVACEDELLAPNAPFDACRELLFSLLDRMSARCSP